MEIEKLIKEMLLAALYIYDGESIEYWKCIHDKIMKQAEEFGHRGDCTKEPYTCAKCLLEDMNNVIDEVYEYYRGKIKEISNAKTSNL